MKQQVFPPEQTYTSLNISREDDCVCVYACPAMPNPTISPDCITAHSNSTPLSHASYASSHTHQSTYACEAITSCANTKLTSHTAPSAYPHGGYLVAPRSCHHAKLTGVVLAGGYSRRLGHDKAQIHLQGMQHHDMLCHTVELLSSLVDEVWVSCQPDRTIHKPYARIHDMVQGFGPLGGIMTALHAAHGAILVIPCDLPFMTTARLKTLIAAWKTRPRNTVMTTFLQIETGYIESLVSIYDYESLPFFQRAVNEQRCKLSTIIDVQYRHYIPYTHHQAQPFFNINFPADLKKAQHIISTTL